LALSGCVLDLAAFVARSAVVDARVGVDLAAVAVLAVAVGEPGVAARDDAHALVTGGGAVQRRAEVAASVTVIGVRAEVDLATVLGVAVAVTKAVGALGLAALTVHTPRGKPGLRRADVAAGTAVVDVVEDALFAAVREVTVAVGEARFAVDGALALDAAGRAAERRADVAAGAAVVDVGVPVDLAAVLGVAVAVEVTVGTRRDHTLAA